MGDLRRELEADLDAFESDEAWPAEVLLPTGEKDADGADEIVTEPEPLPDKRAAEGVMRRLKRLRAEGEEITALTQGEIDRLTRWRDDRLAGVQREIEWGERALDAFTRRMLAGKRVRSIPLPDGTLRLRDQSDRCVVTDAVAFAEWAYSIDEDGNITLNHPETVRVKIEPDLDNIKRNADRGEAFRNEEGEIAKLVSLPGGELIPGIEIHRGEHPTFSAKPNAQ